MGKQLSAVAVDAVPYAIDKPYDYCIPEKLLEKAKIGCRVLVPFGRGNERREAIILSLHEDAADGHYKALLEVLDDPPVLDTEMLRLAVFMRERLFCTFFDCVRAMLPAALWFKRQEHYTLASRIDKSQLSALQAGENDEAKLFSLFSMEKPAVSLEDITQVMGKNMAVVLDELCAQGLLQYHSGTLPRTQDKTERMYTLISDKETAMSRIKRGRSAVRRDVISCLSDSGAMNARELQYMTGASDAVLRGMVKSGILHTFQEKRLRTPDWSDVPESPPVVLSLAQQQVYEKITDLRQSERPSAALLFGVTGSGKTQIYIKLIADTFEQGKSSIILVPEIGLTPQVIRIFISHFGSQVAVLHSALSAGERYDSWNRIRAGDARVVIGTRSAVFAPVRNLGIIIIDEEQDAAYKSEQSPRYHARDIAKYRVAKANAFLLLGSATPSIESYFGAEQGKYPVFHLSERYLGTELPQVMVADMRGIIRKGIDGVIGPILQKQIEYNLQNKQQTILFLNRRGNSRTIGCSMCGWIPECPSCSSSLTYHSANNRAMCHYCGYSVKMTGICPDCGSSHLYAETPGTQKVEQELTTLWPQARILRMDADTTSARGAHEKLIHAFGSGKADILLGTQMVTKGLDFENVTLVGVLDADQSLYAQDYRARERAFALITQVVGRAGRRFTLGRAVIQTYSPEHDVILTAARQDYLTFYHEEIERRQALRFPPIEQLFVLTAIGEAEEQVLAALLRLKARLEGLMQGQFSDFKYPILGPAPAAIVRISGRFRYHLTLRCPDNKRRRELIAGVMREFAGDKRNRGVNLIADQNPDSI